MVSAISIGTVICIIAAMAGDTSQDLKTGYIVGATPRLQQIGELIGAIVAAFAIGGVMYLLNAAWGFGSDQIPAPQATLMKMVVEGVMGGTLPWVLIFMGVFIAIVVEILGIPVLAFSIGLYLPIYLSTPIMVGGLIRWFIDNKRKYDSDAARKDLFPVGRLDKDTEGLLLITNDGALSHRLLSPKSHVSKVYEAVIDGKVIEEDRQAFAEGLDIGDDKPTLPAELTILETTEKEPGIFESRIRITICEGRFHQIKRMFEKVGKTVVYLKRLSMGSLELDPALPKGSARLLTQEEKAALGIADAETQKGK